MCGIFGWLSLAEVSPTTMEERATTLGAKLRHRGPNDFGYAAFSANSQTFYTESSTATAIPSHLLLGQTRLSVIDVSSLGHQPMFSQDKRYCLVYNGEIYNYKELRLELQRAGLTFHTETETEVVLQALVFWGQACLRRFVGMFALALYDRHEKHLFCARDGFGIKPFYWTSVQGFAFASELPALLSFPQIPRHLNLPAVAAYLDGGIMDCGDVTLLEDVFTLPAGHCLEVDVRQRHVGKPSRWWIPPVPTPRAISFEDAAHELKELFLDSVRLHLRSDVPLGVALSGGIDSSAVACCVRRLEPDFPIHTFSYVATDSKKYCEEHWVDIINAHIDAIPHKVHITAEDLPRDIMRLVDAQGEPFVSTSMYAQYRIFQAASEAGITVMLEGQGADEMLAGYRGYVTEFFQTMMAKKRLDAAFEILQQRSRWPSPFTVWSILRPYLASLLHADVKENIKRVIGRKKPHKAYDTSCPDLVPSRDCLRDTLAWQLCWYGLPTLLRYGDRNAMAFSLENRVPFCTIPLAEFCLSLPPEFLVSPQGETKRVFRAAMRGIVPDAILDRRDKVGFATPELSWFERMRPWLEQTLTSQHCSGLVDGKNSVAELHAMLNKTIPFDWKTWRRANFILWSQRMLP